MQSQSTSPAAEHPPSTPSVRRSVSRWSGKVFGVALAALLFLPLAEATQPAVAGKKFKTITETISSPGQIDIPDAGSSGPANHYPATLNVNKYKDFKKARITDVNLTLREMTHTDPDDINVLLTHGNRRAIVMSDVGGSSNINGTTLELDDQAGASLPDATLLTDGAFRPTKMVAGDVFPAPASVPNSDVALSTFDGDDPDGQWQLFVHDDGAGDTDVVSGGWKLEITAKVKNDKNDKKHKKGKHKKDKGT